MEVGIHRDRDYNAARFRLEFLGQRKLGLIKFHIATCPPPLLFYCKRRANMNAHGNPDWAPLNQSSLYGDFDMSRLLLDNDVDVNIQQDNLQRP